MRIHLQHFFVLSVLVLPVTAMTSCDESLPEYSFGFYNATGAQIVDTRADWQARGTTYHDGAGILGVGGSGAVSHQQPRPIPENVAVAWKTADGEVHNKVVAVAKLIADPPRFSGTIYFKFGPDGGVTAVPLTYAQERQAAEHGKSAIRDGVAGRQGDIPGARFIR